MTFKYNSTGIKMEKSFSAAPAGTYWLIIRKASDEKDGEKRITKNGDPYVSVECEIDEGEWMGNKVWTNVNFLGKDENGKPKKGAGMAVHFIKSIGQPWEGDFEVTPGNWVGKKFKAKLKLGTDNKGNPKNEIAYVLSDEKEEEVPF